METISTNLLLKNTPTAIAIVDTKLNLINYSDQWLTNFALNNNDIRGKYIFDVINETPTLFEETLKTCLERNEDINCGQKFILSNGKVKWLKWKISPWENTDNILVGLMIFLEDITEAKREIELLEKAELVAKIGGWEVNLINKTVYWSRTTKDIHEVDRSFIPNLEEGINFYKKGVHRDKINKLVSAAIEEGKPWDTELIIVTAKGNELWVRAKGEAEIENDKVVRLIGTFQDIDVIKKVELAYKEISERLKIATKGANIGIWEYDVENNQLLWDDNMYALYGIKEKDFSGVYEAWQAGVHPEDKERGSLEIEKAISSEKEFDTEFRVLWPNGKIKHIKAVAKTIKNNHGSAAKLIGVNWDITDRIETEKKTQLLVEVTKSQNESLMNFAHIVSHNLRSHSTNLNMLTKFLSDEEDEEERRDLNGMITEAAKSLTETISHLNDVVQVKTGTLENLKSISVLNTIVQIKKSIRGLLNEKDAKLEIEVSKLHFVNAVPAYLESIFLNILTNALKYSSPERTPIIKIKSDLKNDNVLISFSDNGLGIDLKRHGDKIFGMYKTFHKHKDAKGIGLFITKNQIEAMSGSIQMESSVGRGTTIYIELKQD